ncbi:MAG TPA: transglycosylase SLT domain-containing protein [Gaiellaceae bacterium]|nr:transglycosylase SLT domain-containing protein [Gaiellaceae bacterium]
MTHRWPLVVAAFACALGLLAARAEAAPAPLSPVANALAEGDPLAFAAGTVPRLERSAAFGHSGALYARSPGGAVETARRVAQWRPQIERAVAGSGFSADVLEGIVFLESAGRADAIAPGSVNSASGLVQIMGYTANDFLGMNVKVHQSRALTNRINVAKARGQHARARRLEAQRRRIDARFDPPKALAAAVRYLKTARGYLGRNDLAVASYHMGIGNMQSVVRAYAGKADADVAYARIFFDSGPDRNAAAWEKLLSLGDDSRHYYFKVLAAKRIMHLYRTNPAELAAVARLHARKHSHEEVMHPSSRTRVFDGAREIAAAREGAELLPVPNRPDELHFEISPGMGSLAPKLGVKKTTYRALRPEALAALTYLAQRVQQVGGTKTPLILTSTVRDWGYQRRLMRVNTMAARSYSIHTTGYAFDIARAWNSRRQAAAVQFVLDRMVAHGLIAYIKEPHAIHVAVSRDAEMLIPAMLGARASEADPAPEVEVDPPLPAKPLAPELREEAHVVRGRSAAEPPAEATQAAAAAAKPRVAETPAEPKRGFLEQLRDFLGVWTPTP